MKKDLVNILSIIKKRKRTKEVHIYPPSVLSKDTTKANCIGLGKQDGGGDNSVGINTGEQDTIRRSSIFGFSATFDNWDSFGIGPGAIIDTEELELIIIDSFTANMSYRMGTMASSPTFTLGIKVSGSQSVGTLAEDKKSINNGCDNTDDTFNGEIGSISHDGLVSIQAYLSSGTVTQSCSNNHKHVSAEVSGTIIAKNAELGSYNTSNMSIVLG